MTTDITDNAEVKAEAPETLGESLTTATTEAVSLLGDATEIKDEQHEGLVDINLVSPDIRDSNLIKKFVKEDKLDVNNVIKSLVNAESLIGKRITDADEDTLKDIYTKLKVPANPEDYELKDIEGKDEFKKFFTNIAAETKISKEAAQTIYEKILEDQAVKEKTILDIEEKAIKENKQILEKEFGSALEKRIKAANKALDLFGSEDLRKYLTESGAANNAEVVKFLASIGAKYASQTNFTSDVEKVVGTTPADADNQIKQLFNDKDFMEAWYSVTHPKHGEAKAKLENLYKIRAAK